VLPRLSGRPIRVEIRRCLGPHLAATSIPRRLVLLDASVLHRRGEFERILIHEIFHFAWVRLPNATRQSWEQVLITELDRNVPGELGWSAEWRKCRLSRSDHQSRTRAWRRYACESFCDSAAWLFAGFRTHDDFTLPPRFRHFRRNWLEANLPVSSGVPI
jgi:hypothetical protein